MSRILTLPNALTASRFVLAPIFLLLYARGDTVRALAAFAAAAATDVLDGLAARVLRQHSRLGAVLDPIADKVLATCALFALAARDRLPLWLPLLVVSRDAAQLLGAALLRLSGRRLPAGPTRIGKYATFALAALVVLSLAWELMEGAPGKVAPILGALGLLAAECIAVSWIQYGLYFVRALRQPPREAPA
ncbi:MAG TPA: CDP-alcohol phosphatidyltransferase family protein [Anaeromyxobacteraceae bacterium]|nr:CDP-alcohol phosphatidyltransferase family protein [Anaeromyxobacteraceae bacterium]